MRYELYGRLKIYRIRDLPIGIFDYQRFMYCFEGVFFSGIICYIRNDSIMVTTLLTITDLPSKVIYTLIRVQLYNTLRTDWYFVYLYFITNWGIRLSIIYTLIEFKCITLWGL
ncbi:hypothetical protein C1646_698310 [Rhizophagus diaphanus]|nr:hypothetical protein C1646_698310 [Rhizophagus diaphanus] [Rhizophagus sp. MUCL 43196]